jgi:hypothetical protein
MPNGRWACLCYFCILFFPLGVQSINDILDQHFLSFMGPLRSRHLIRFRKHLRFRVRDTILSIGTLPYFPLGTVDVSSSTCFRLIDSVSNLVTYSSSSTTFSRCLILSLHLWPFRVTRTYWPGASNFGGVIFLSNFHSHLLHCKVISRIHFLYLALCSKITKC